jgi:hypothetical protein
LLLYFGKRKLKSWLIHSQLERRKQNERKLVLPIMKADAPCAVFRLGIYKEPFEQLTELSEKTGIPKTKLASMMIQFAYEHIEFEEI